MFPLPIAETGTVIAWSCITSSAARDESYLTNTD